MGEMPLGLALKLAGVLLRLDDIIATHPPSLALLRRVTKTADALSFLESHSLVRSVSAQFADALSDALSACQNAKRLLIVVEDLHFADEHSRDLLALLVTRMAGTRLAWVITSRFDRTGNSPSILSCLTSIRVPALNPEGTAELALRTAHAHSLSLSALELSAVAQVSAGNPLFVRELSLETSRHGTVARLPHTLESVISDRLGRLDEAHTRLVRATLLLGAEATTARVRAITRTGDIELAQCIEQLEDDGIITTHSEGRLALHECWRRAVSDAIPPATRSSLSLMCAEAMLAAGPRQLDAAALWTAADLLREAGELSKAQELLGTSAHLLYQCGLLDQSAEVYDRALGIATRSDLSPQLALGLARARLSSGSPGDALEALAEYEIDIGRFRPASAAASSLRAEATAKLCLPHNTSLEQSLTFVLDESLDESFRLQLGLTVARLSANSHLHTIEKVNAQTVSQLRVKHPRLLSGILASIIFHTEHGSLEELRPLQTAVEVGRFDTVGATEWCAGMRILAHSLRLCGDIERSVVAAAKAFELAKHSALPDDAAIAAELCANILLDNCNPVAARTWIESAETVLSRPTYAQRSVALSHLRERLALQTGSSETCVDMTLPRWAEIEADPVVLSRLTRLATLTLACANAGHRTEALEARESALRLVEEVLGHSAGDYPIEQLSQAERALMGNTTPAQIAMLHVERRDARFIRPLAPLFTDLQLARALLA